MGKFRVEFFLPFLLSLALTGLLLPMHLSNITLIIFIMSSFILQISQKRSIVPKKRQLFFAGFFLLFPLGMLYTENSNYGWKIVERNMVWFLIPSIVPMGLIMKKSTLFKSFKFFSLAVHLLIYGLLIMAFLDYLTRGDSQVFYYDQLTKPINFHPVYLAVYLLFGMLILIESWRKKELYISKYVLVLLVLFDFVLLVLLSSKTVLISFVIVLLVLLFRELKTMRQIGLSIIGIIALGALVMKFSETKKRINDSLFSSWELLDKETFKYNDPFTGITLRLITWKYVVKKYVAKENLFIGIGTGDDRDFINEVYKDRNMDDAGYLNFNLHNQYLEYFLKFGLIGLLYFLTILFLSFRKAIKEKNKLYFSFLLIFCLFSLTESNLEVQRGIVFFVLINAIFYFFPQPTEQKENE